MKPFKSFIRVTFVIVLGLAAQARAQTPPTTLHAFTGQLEETDNYPYARLVQSGSTFYGTTYGGSENSEGTVFKVNTNGTGFTVLYTFTGGTDGANPEAGLVLSDGILYGTASGGAGGYGTVFSFNTSSKVFTVLHPFTDNANNNADGGVPQAGLVLSGSMLYGTTSVGGLHELGTVYSLGTNGQAFNTLWSFTGSYDEATPYGQLLLYNGILYGTVNGQGVGAGTVFSLPAQ